MFRLSRIHAPRGTLAAFALVVVAMLLFGIIAQAHGPVAAPLACMAELDASLVEISER
ncbi:MAG: hypothetical protein OXI90_06040 [Gammaproteobacteria bacterium]|nr:hypothetical protein [Gammaproteobacteria bacterium]